jgi:hypothetical protein
MLLPIVVKPAFGDRAISSSRCAAGQAEGRTEGADLGALACPPWANLAKATEHTSLGASKSEFKLLGPKFNGRVG